MTDFIGPPAPTYEREPDAWYRWRCYVMGIQRTEPGTVEFVAQTGPLYQPKR